MRPYTFAMRRDFIVKQLERDLDKLYNLLHRRGDVLRSATPEDFRTLRADWDALKKRGDAAFDTTLEK